MSFLRLFAYLLNGSSEMTMSRAWLSNKKRMQAYDAYTARENASAYVSRDAASFQREAFWKSREQPVGKVIRLVHGKRA